MSLTGYFDFVTLPLLYAGAILAFKDYFSDRFIMWSLVFMFSGFYVSSVYVY